MDQWIALAEDLAQASGRLIMDHYSRPVAVETKSDKTPVTRADREAEALMRGMIQQRFPDHQVVGEEQGRSGPEESPLQWMLDPIDGTKSFIRKVPLFGTLIALLEDGVPVIGVIHMPCSGELLLGVRGRATTLNGEPVRVSATAHLREATVVVTSTADMQRHGHGEPFRRLEGEVALVRSWGDCHGHLMVATGRADVMLDPILAPWDVAALRPCVEGAGGRLTDWNGEARPLGESAISSNGLLHDDVLRWFGSGGE